MVGDRGVSLILDWIAFEKTSSHKW